MAKSASSSVLIVSVLPSWSASSLAYERGHEWRDETDGEHPVPDLRVSA